MKFITNWLDRWVAARCNRQWKGEEDRLLNFKDGGIPRAGDSNKVHLDYCVRLLAAYDSPEGQALMYRMQILYNRVHNNLRKLDITAQKDSQAVSLMVAQLHTMYQVLADRDSIVRRIKQLQQEVRVQERNLESAGIAGKTSANRPVWQGRPLTEEEEAEALLGLRT